MQIRSPKNVKEIQKLVGKLTAMSKFIPKLAEKIGLIIRLLKKRNKFEWSQECDELFAQLKQFMVAPPVLQKPIHGQNIMVYLSISEEVISLILVQEADKEQKHVYFGSRTFWDAKKRYQIIEKVMLAMIFTARRTRAYF